ncbi:MAG: hypothetical protein Q8862_10215 [Bacteroidota bacterium]|nr:hypothetical protein [Bacteroidota bacterium]
MYCFLSGSYGHGGGAQTIQVLLFKSLTQRGEKCKLFDVKDGSVHLTFLETNIPFEFIEIDKPRSKKDYSKFLQDDDLLIVFDTNLFNNLLYFSNSNCKILVWEIFYPWVDHFIPNLYLPIKWYTRQQEELILREIVRNNAFFFIDYMGKEATERRLKISISDDYYLPIPIEMPLGDNLKKAPDSNVSISYVGRSVNWKINPFIHILRDFKKIKSPDLVKYIVVCDDTSLFKAELEKKFDAYNDIPIQFFEKLTLEQLNHVLEKSDLHFAMGAAALDGAKLGIPTILIDASYSDFPEDYKYRWVFETEKLNLGKMLKADTISYDGKHTLEEVILDLKMNWTTISLKCREYVEMNYGLGKITDEIVNYKKSARLTWMPFRNLFINRYLKILRRFGIR